MINSNPTSDVSSSSSHVSPHQVHTLILLYPRLASLIWTPLMAPLLVPIAFHLVNYITYGHALVALMTAVILWRAGIRAIYHYSSRANNNNNLVDKALADNEIRLPVLAATTSTAMVAIVASQWQNHHHYDDDNNNGSDTTYLAWYPGMYHSAVVLLRCECIILLGQVAVFLRYIGPLSIMRCSSVPLKSNPFESYVWYIVRFPGTLLGLPDNFLESSASRSRGGSVAAAADNGGSRDELQGRRYCHASFSATFMLLVVGALEGCLLYSASVGFPSSSSSSTSDDYYHHQHKAASAAAMTACILLILSPMLQFVRQKNHELDPRPYQYVAQGWAGEMTQQAAIDAALTTSCIVVVAWIVDAVTEHRWWMGSWTGALQLAVFTWFFLTASKAWEECLRLALFYPRSNILQDMLDMADGSPTVCVQTILQCLLVDGTLVQDIQTSNNNRGAVLLQDAMIRQTNDWSARHGKQLLQKVPLYVEAPLEEDVIRFAILEALGGPDDRGIARKWVDMSLPLTHGGKSPEPPCATLVRGFCAVSGGMAHALETIVKQANVANSKARRLDTWELSVGGLLSLEYAVRGLTRLLAATPTMPRTAKQLETLVPAALTSMYQLHHALDKYRENQGSIIVNHFPFDLVQHVLRTCEASAARVSATMFDGPTTKPPVVQDVWKWLKQVQDLVGADALQG